MEILALLLLGLIAMLAIVPPIIRGKLDDSPLITTQSFHRSMQEIGDSLEPHNSGAGGTYRKERSPAREALAETGGDTRFRPAPRPASRRTRAAVRRNRILTVLLFSAFICGAATLISGEAWCLVLFAAVSCLLFIYWGLTLIVPRLATPARPPRAVEDDSRPPKSHAL